MINQILLVFLGVFAVIGLICSLYAAAESISRGRGEKKINAELVLFANSDCRKEIEGIVRDYAARLCSGICSVRADTLTVVLTDEKESPEYVETLDILTRLEQDISLLKVYTESQYLSHIKHRCDM